jgi:HEAT repeat protein
MDRMGSEMMEKPGRIYPVSHNHNQSKECSQQYHPLAVHTNCLSVPGMGSGTAEAVLLFPDIISLLTSGDRETRITAIVALGKLGDRRAIEPLFRACMDEDDLVKQAARDALAAIAMKSR